MPTAAQLEVEYEQAFVAGCEAMGCLCLKLAINGRRGFPDRTVLCPGGRTLYFEWKRPGGRLSAQQCHWINRLNARGPVAFAVDDVAEAIDLVRFFGMELTHGK